MTNNKKDNTEKEINKGQNTSQENSDKITESRSDYVEKKNNPKESSQEKIDDALKAESKIEETGGKTKENDFSQEETEKVTNPEKVAEMNWFKKTTKQVTKQTAIASALFFVVGGLTVAGISGSGHSKGRGHNFDQARSHSENKGGKEKSDMGGRGNSSKSEINNNNTESNDKNTETKEKDSSTADSKDIS